MSWVKFFVIKMVAAFLDTNMQQKNRATKKIKNAQKKFPLKV